jgi:hypothetical protein
MTYKIVKNEQTVKANSLTKDEAIKRLAIIADDCAMATGFYLTDENHTITNQDNGRVIFTAGDESATIGDDKFEIIEETD